MPIESFGGALVKHSHQRSHRLIRLKVLLVLVPQLLADRGTRLAARRLLFWLDRLLVELLQVVLDDEPLVNVAAFFLGGEDAAIVEVQDAAADLGVVDAQRAAGLETWVEAVLGGGLEVHRLEFLLVLVDKPLVGHFPVAEILVDKRTAVDDGAHVVPLEQTRTEAAPTRPRVGVRQLAVNDRHRPDRPEIRFRRGASHSQDARIGLITPAVPVQHLLHQTVDAARSRLPGVLEMDRRELHLDVFPTLAVQIEHRRHRSTPTNDNMLMPRLSNTSAAPPIVET